MWDVIVIGAGIIGATVAKAMKAQGRTVLLLDDARPMSGTGPSGGHLKPSWFGGMPKEQFEPAMALLNDTWGLVEEQFLLRPSDRTDTVWRVDTDQVLAYGEVTPGHVHSIDMLNNYPRVYIDVGYRIEERCRLLVVAAGVWCTELLNNSFTILAKQGVSFRLPYTIQKPFILPWAPYKQVVAHQQGPNEVWVGDGSTVYPRHWSEARTQACLKRCGEAVNYGGQPTKTLMGYRPYVANNLLESPTDPCLLKQLGPRAWVATGAGKLGTIAAGWVARRLLDQ